MLVDANGKAIADRIVIDELPVWCRGVTYRAHDDIITLLVHVPASHMANEHILGLECEPAQARALVEALSRCLTQSEEAERVVDVPPAPVS